MLFGLCMAAFLSTSFNACPPSSTKRVQKIQARKGQVLSLEKDEVMIPDFTSKDLERKNATRQQNIRFVKLDGI